MKSFRPYYLRLAVLLICAFVGAMAYRLAGIPQRNALEVQLARARRLGLPKNMSGLWPSAKDPAQNAAPIYTSLSKGPSPVSKAAYEAEKLGPPKTAADSKAIRAILAPTAPYLASVESATMLPECRFQRKAAYDVILPEYALMRNAARLLAIRATCESQEGHPDRAMRTLQSAARIADQLREERLLVAKLVQVDIEDAVIQGTERVLESSGHRADVRSGARKVLTNFGPPPDIKEGWLGEWAWQRQVIKEYKEGRISYDELAKMLGLADDPNGNALFRVQMRLPSFRFTQEANAARVFLDFYEAVPNDPSKVKAFQKAVDLRQSVLATREPGMTLATLGTQFQPVSYDAGAKAIVRRRLLEGLLNALDTPVPPLSLPLAPEKATDPFSGKPLYYGVTHGEIRLWSVGDTRKDEGDLAIHGKVRKP